MNITSQSVLYVKEAVQVDFMWYRIPSGFLSAFCPMGGKMRLYGLLGGGQVCICVQSMRQTRGIWGHAPLGNFDFGPLLDAIWWNLGLFLHKHNLPFIV